MCSQRAAREKGEIHQLNPTDPALGLTWMGVPSAVNAASSNPKNIPPERETFRLPEAAKCKSSTEMPKIFHVQCLAVHLAPPLSSLNIPKEQEPLRAEILPGNTPQAAGKAHLGRVVLGGSDEHGHVPGGLDVVDLLGVLLDIRQLLP